MKRTIVVSGGGTGIGRAIARSFALSGDLVIIIGRRPTVLRQTAEHLNAEAQKIGLGHVEPSAADLQKPEEVLELAERIHREHYRVDVLVNNAGGVSRQPASKLSEIADSWVSDFKSNVLTAVMLTSCTPSEFQMAGRPNNQHEFDSSRPGRWRVLLCCQGCSNRMDPGPCQRSRS